MFTTGVWTAIMDSTGQQYNYASERSVECALRCSQCLSIQSEFVFVRDPQLTIAFLTFISLHSWGKDDCDRQFAIIC
jgi:hypothetical protein